MAWLGWRDLPSVGYAGTPVHQYVGTPSTPVRTAPSPPSVRYVAGPGHDRTSSSRPASATLPPVGLIDPRLDRLKLVG